ncbi:MAG: hypothetical protein Q9N67_10235 [Ghiorsea sp.]|nr:hypothetical protein [Ghiorsea sp.]
MDKLTTDDFVKRELAKLSSYRYTVDEYLAWCIDSVKEGSDPWEIFQNLQADIEWEVLNKLAQYFVDNQLYEKGYALPRRLQQWLLEQATGARKPRQLKEDFKTRNKLFFDILATLKQDYKMPITIRGIESVEDNIGDDDHHSCGCALLAKHTGLSHNQVKDIYDKASKLEKYFIKNDSRMT